MPAIKGSKVRVKQGDGADPESFTIVAGSRSVRCSFGSDEIDVTSADDIIDGVTFRTYLGGVADFSASMSALIKDKDTFAQMAEDFLNDVVRNYEIEVEGFLTISGPMRVTTFDINAEFTDAGTYDFTLRAAAALQVVRAT